MATAPDPAHTRHSRTPRVSLVRRLAVAALALGAAVQIFSSQVSTIALLAQQPQYAARLPFAQARPAAMRAWQLAMAGAPTARVVDVARIANQGTVLDEPGFAAIARTLGPQDAGSAWLDHAWLLSRRDPWLLQARFDRAHARGDTAGEIAALAALLQLQLPPGSMRETLLADLARPAAFAQALAALREPPRWRHRFFDGLHPDPAGSGTAVALIAALRDNGAPLPGDDMTALLAPLVYGPGANPALADMLWRAWLGKADPWAWPTATGKAVHLPFDWTLGDHAHVIDSQLAFSGKDSADETVATRQIYLPAGQYRFVARPGQGLTQAAISAIVTCDGQHVPLVNGAIWRTASACPMAELRVIANATDGTIVSAALQPLPGG